MTGARDTVKRYVRLCGDMWTPPRVHDERTEAVYQEVRAEVLREAADHFVAHCFTHTPGLHHGYMQCHCEAAAELRALAKEQP